MKTQVIKFKDLRKSYSVVIGQNVLRILPSKIKNLCPKTKKIVVIMDKNVPTIYRRKIKKSLKKYKVIFYNFNAN